MLRNILLVAVVAAAVLVFGALLGRAQPPSWPGATYVNLKARPGQVLAAKTSAWQTITIDSEPVHTPFGPVSAYSYADLWRHQQDMAKEWALARQAAREEVRKDLQALPALPARTSININSRAESR